MYKGLITFDNIFFIKFLKEKSMNRTIFYYLSLLLVVFILTSCDKGDKSISITGLKLSPDMLLLDVGSSSTLGATIYPLNATDQTLVWSSLDPAIATVSPSGVVTGTGPGVIEIKVSTSDGRLASACIVTVTKWTTFTSKNSGLANDTIFSIAIDTHGNKWFGTFEGVSGFDGSEWTSYNTSNSNLLSDYVYSIGIDNQDNKWFGNNFGLSQFDNTIWTNFDTINSELASFPVNAIAFDSQDNAWIGTTKGISKFDGTNWTTYNTTNCELINDGIITIEVDELDNIWFGSIGGVSRFDGANWIWYTSGNGLAGQNVNAIVMDKQGNMWFGTDYGLSKFDGTNWTTYLYGTQINAVAVDAQDPFGQPEHMK
jgi:streptogramin lyase